jgi:hypothetical protein
MSTLDLPVSPHTADLIATACPIINTLGAAFYFVPETTSVGKEHGLDGFRFYVLGRGGVLGDVEAPVIESAFAWWAPELIAKMWNSAKEKMSPRDAGRLYLKCAQDMGRATFANVDDLGAFCAGAEKITRAANPAGLALFAGLAAEPLAEDLPGQAMQHLAVLREFRGSAHIVAVLASGLTPKIAHAIKRPDMMKSFGWGEETVATTAAQATALESAETLTDRLVAPAFSALTADEATAFLAALANLKTAMG